MNSGIWGQKSNARTCFVFHCDGASGSVGTHASVRRGAGPSRRVFEADGR